MNFQVGHVIYFVFSFGLIIVGLFVYDVSLPVRVCWVLLLLFYAWLLYIDWKGMNLRDFVVVLAMLFMVLLPIMCDVWLC